jgi:O-acetyl-ADP-ribose deacetylase (regulator of RNase III)
MTSFLKKFNKKDKNSMNTKIRCVAGDIVSIGTDIIVNAANTHLRAGGGVCGAIFKGAGMQQLQQARLSQLYQAQQALNTQQAQP